MGDTPLARACRSDQRAGGAPEACRSLDCHATRCERGRNAANRTSRPACRASPSGSYATCATTTPSIPPATGSRVSTSTGWSPPAPVAANQISPRFMTRKMTRKMTRTLNSSWCPVRHRASLRSARFAIRPRTGEHVHALRRRIHRPDGTEAHGTARTTSSDFVEPERVASVSSARLSATSVRKLTVILIRQLSELSCRTQTRSTEAQLSGLRLGGTHVTGLSARRWSGRAWPHTGRGRHGSAAWKACHRGH